MIEFPLGLCTYERTKLGHIFREKKHDQKNSDEKCSTISVFSIDFQIDTVGFWYRKLTWKQIDDFLCFMCKSNQKSICLESEGCQQKS